MKKSLRIAVIGDGWAMRSLVQDALRGRGHTVTVFVSQEAFLRTFVNPRDCDMVIVEHHTSGATGLRLLRYLRQEPGFEKLLVIVYSSDESIKLRVREAGGIFSGPSVVALDRAIDEVETSTYNMA